MIKGQLISKKERDSTVERIYDSYFKRLWNNNENYIHETGFEAAWKVREAEMFTEEIQKVAVLGGHYD